jgi:hypothetical protein
LHSMLKYMTVSFQSKDEQRDQLCPSMVNKNPVLLRQRKRVAERRSPYFRHYFICSNCFCSNGQFIELSNCRTDTFTTCQIVGTFYKFSN